MNGLKALEAIAVLAIFIKQFIDNKRARHFGFAGEIRKPSIRQALRDTIQGR